LYFEIIKIINVQSKTALLITVKKSSKNFNYELGRSQRVESQLAKISLRTYHFCQGGGFV